jgi:hypothetical protein
MLKVSLHLFNLSLLGCQSLWETLLRKEENTCWKVNERDKKAETIDVKIKQNLSQIYVNEARWLFLVSFDHFWSEHHFLRQLRQYRKLARALNLSAISKFKPSFYRYFFGVTCPIWLSLLFSFVFLPSSDPSFPSCI